MTTDQPAQGSTADHCPAFPGEPHHLVLSVRSNALVSVTRCSLCGWIDFDDLREQAGALLAEGRRQATDDATVEHGIRMSGGGHHIRLDHPEIERIFPLADWIRANQRFGGKVDTRRIVVVADWTEVPR